MNTNQTVLAYFEYSRDTPLFRLNSKFEREAQESLLARYIKKRSGKGLDGYEIDACIPLRMSSLQRKNKIREALMWQADLGRKVKTVIRLGWRFKL